MLAHALALIHINLPHIQNAPRTHLHTHKYRRTRKNMHNLRGSIENTNIAQILTNTHTHIGLIESYYIHSLQHTTYMHICMHERHRLRKNRLNQIKLNLYILKFYMYLLKYAFTAFI